MFHLKYHFWELSYIASYFGNCEGNHPKDYNKNKINKGHTFLQPQNIPNSCSDRPWEERDAPFPCTWWEKLLSGLTPLVFQFVEQKKHRRLFLSWEDAGSWRNLPMESFKCLRDLDNLLTSIELESWLCAGNQITVLWDISLPNQQEIDP